MVGGLRVGIDVGGTFTDLVAHDADGGAHVLKVATTPRAPEMGVLDALDRLFERFEERPGIAYLAHSTTIATNALLGQVHLELPRVGLVTTHGFRDVIEIGRQNRSEVYNLFVQRPRPLVAREDRICVRERLDVDGNVLVALDDGEIRRTLDTIAARRLDAVAIGFLHSYVNPIHEARMAQAIGAAFPDLPVTRSSEIDPEYREYERFSSAVVNAALMPIVSGYLRRLRAALDARGIAAPVYVMQSNGGMALDAHAIVRPAAMIESGPASGIIAAARLASQSQMRNVLAFDMGGTTAKAGTIASGVVQVAQEFEAAGATHSGRSIKGSGYPVRFPFVNLAEVSAGGGTIARIDDAGALQVGPLSAGADPGPACYGKSMETTVTDANVVLGRLPQTHLLQGRFPIDASRSLAALSALGQRIGLSAQEAALGVVRIVDAQMAKVLRIVTMERGLDPRAFTLVAFGGNGALHACALADELEMEHVIIPAHPGVFSAEGLVVADLRATLVRSVLDTLDASLFEAITEVRTTLAEAADARLRAQGARTVTFSYTYDMRYRGQSFELEVAHESGAAWLADAFHRMHTARYGYRIDDEPIEVVNVRVHASAPLGEEPRPRSYHAGKREREPSVRDVWIGGAFRATPVFDRATLEDGRRLEGPAIVEQYDTTTYVAPGWHARVRGEALELERRTTFA